MQTRIADFERFAEQQMKIDRIPAVSVGIMKGDFVWTKGFGYADLENQVPAKSESAYRLASVTKPMTAVAIMQLVEQGKIDLDAEVQNYVPYFPKKPWPVTTRQLLGHLGGISHYQDYDLEGHFKTHYDTRQAIGVFEDFDLIAEPGTKYQYSSYGYNLLGAIIEGAAGQSYGDYMTKRVWEPLGMTATRLDDPDDLIPNRVRGYRLIESEIKNSEFVDISSRFAAGGTRSTVGDMLKFARGVNDDAMLSRTSLDLMFTSMTLRDGHDTGYGMGWGIAPMNGRFSARHSGGQAETRTLLIVFPEDDAAIAIGTNFEGASRDPYADRLYRVLFDETPEINLYTENRVDEHAWHVLAAVFNHGMAYFQRYQAPLTKNEQELAEAFEYFNGTFVRDSSQASFAEAQQRLRDGRHPTADRAFVKVGSWVASELKQRLGAEKMQQYHRYGAITFFNDYVAQYAKDPSFSETQQFNSTLATQVSLWQKDWAAAWNDEIRKTSLDVSADPSVIEAKLSKSFAGKKAYPDFTAEVAAIFRQLYANGDLTRAAQWSSLAVRLYPNSDQANTLQAVSLISSGDKEGAHDLLQKAVKRNPSGAASATALNSIAYELATIGRADDGLALLHHAIELHPQVANLYDSIGEFHLNRDDKQKAIEWYQRALEIDPAFENAKRMLEKLIADKSDS